MPLIVKAVITLLSLFSAQHPVCYPEEAFVTRTRANAIFKLNKLDRQYGALTHLQKACDNGLTKGDCSNLDVYRSHIAEQIAALSLEAGCKTRTNKKALRENRKLDNDMFFDCARS